MSSFQALSKARSSRLKHNALCAQPSPAPPPSVVVPPAVPAPLPSPPAPPSPSPYDLPAHLEIQTHRPTGRGVWLKRDGPVAYKAGSSLISTAPYATSLSTSALSTTCAGCFLTSQEVAFERAYRNKDKQAIVQLTPCKGCSVVRYCSTECQSSAGSTHQTECIALASLKRHYSQSKTRAETPPAGADESWIPGEAVRALGRLCIERKRKMWGSSADKEKGVESWWTQIANLDCQRSSMPPANSTTGASAPYAQLALALSIYLGHAISPLSPASSEPTEIPPADMAQFGFRNVIEVLDLCAAFMTNSFTLSSPSLTPIGVAISPTIALFNHSCWPNAVVVFPFGGKGRAKDGKGMEVVALRDLLEGEEVVTSYIDISLPPQLRQAELQARYFFICKCELCTRKDREPNWVDPREMVLPRPSYDGLEEWVRSGMKLLKMEEQGGATDFDQLLTSNAPLSIIGSLSYFYPPWAYPLFPILRMLSTLLIASLANTSSDPSRLNDAIQVALLVSESITAPSIYPPGHPARAMVLAELGKLLLVPVPSTPHTKSSLPQQMKALPGTKVASISTDPVGRLVAARDVLVRAFEELKIGFGSPQGGLVGYEVHGMLEGVTREIQALRRR